MKKAPDTFYKLMIAWRLTHGAQPTWRQALVMICVSDGLSDDDAARLFSMDKAINDKPKRAELEAAYSAGFESARKNAPTIARSEPDRWVGQTYGAMRVFSLQVVEKHNRMYFCRCICCDAKAMRHVTELSAPCVECGAPFWSEEDLQPVAAAVQRQTTPRGTEDE